MDIKVISEIDKLAQLKHLWDKLFKEGSYSVFQTFDFNYYSWIFELSLNNRNQLVITFLYKNDILYAILPLYIDSKKRLRFLNDTHSDFCDFISTQDLNLLEIINKLKCSFHFKSFSMKNILINSNAYNSSINFNSKLKIESVCSEYSTLDINKGVFPYNVPHFRSHQKHRINKALKKNNFIKGRVLNNLIDVFPREQLKLLAKEMIISGVRKHEFFSSKRLSLIESLYNSGLVILHVMVEQNKIRCCNIIMRNSSKKYILWIDLFDSTKMINISSYICFIKLVSENKSITINFGRGRYFYKKSNFSPSFDNLYRIDVFFDKWSLFKHMIFENAINIYRFFTKKIKK